MSLRVIMIGGYVVIAGATLVIYWAVKSFKAVAVPRDPIDPIAATASCHPCHGRGVGACICRYRCPGVKRCRGRGKLTPPWDDNDFIWAEQAGFTLPEGSER